MTKLLTVKRGNNYGYRVYSYLMYINCANGLQQHRITRKHCTALPPSLTAHAIFIHASVVRMSFFSSFAVGK